KRSGLVWTPQTLRAWLIDPQATVPGNHMPYSGASPEDADRIVAWLARHQARENARRSPVTHRSAGATARRGHSGRRSAVRQQPV
ncbi:c-type cytochrome, partial [Streptomyces galilaeus]|uniref:c-type cytochrome n=1 Tax=Streptomyces galilaeus TaxID=33899 RepID=UPI0038F6AFD1